MFPVKMVWKACVWLSMLKTAFIARLATLKITAKISTGYVRRAAVVLHMTECKKIAKENAIHPLFVSKCQFRLFH